MKNYLFIFMSILTVFSCSDQPFVVGVDSPLRVVYVSPTDSAVNVSRDTTIKVVFSEEVVESTLAENIVLYDYSKKDESIRVDTTLTYSKDTNTVILKPNKGLNFATTYLIRVKSGITKVDTKDSKGGQLAREVSALFTTEYIDDLKIISVFPANGATQVSPDTNIVITFSEPIDNTPPSFDQTTSFVVCDMGTENSYTEGKCNNPIAGSWSFDEKKVNAIFTPEIDFGYTRFVRLILSTTIRSQRAKDFGDKVGDIYYGHLKADYILDFSTRLLDRFDVVSVMPANGSNAVNLDSKVIITFSEPVNTDSVLFYNKEGDETSLKDTATLYVEDITDKNNITPYYLNGEWDSDKKILTLSNVDPKDPQTIKDFPYSRDIRITLKSKIQSERGKSLINPPQSLKNSQGYLNNGESDYISYFSTINPPELLIVNRSPDSEATDVSIRSVVKITFSEPIDLSSITYPENINSENYTFKLTDITDEANPSLIEPGDIVNPFKVDSNDPNTVIFTPEYPLNYLHTYEVEIKEGIKSQMATLKSGFLRSPILFRFTTEGVEKFYVTNISPENESENNSIYAKTRIRFNRAFNTSSLLKEYLSGNVTEIQDRKITDNNASMSPDELMGYIVRFSNNDNICYGFITDNTEKTFELLNNPACAVDNTFTYEIFKPSLILSISNNYIAPVKLDEPFYYYKSYITSGSVNTFTNNTITDPTKSFKVDELKGKVIKFVRGKLAQEEYEIESNTSDTITITGQFTNLPDTTSEYIIVESANIFTSVISSADKRSIKIDGADFGIDELKGFELSVIDGTGKEQVKGIIANDKDTVFIDSDFDTVPDNTMQIVIRDAREFIFVPEKTIAYNAIVNGEITDSTEAAILDSLNGNIKQETFSFNIINAPELVIKSVSPSDKADGIDTETTIKVFFSEAVKPTTVKKESGNIQLFDSNSNPVDFTIVPVGVESDNIEIIPVRTTLNLSRLKYSEQYTLTLKSGIASLRGGFLGQDYSFTFKTIDPPPLTLVSASPSNADTQITTGVKRETQPNSGIPTSFVFTFSEGLKQANINNTSIKLEDVTSLADPFDLNTAGTPIIFSINFNSVDEPPEGSLGIGTDNILTITPSDILNYSTVVRIVLVGQDDPSGSRCSDTSNCKTDGIFTSDRATNEGGQLQNSYVVVFRIEDPAQLGIVQVASISGNSLLKRDDGGKTEGIFVRFTEGILQSSFSLNSNVFLEDITGLNDPVNGQANSSIAADISFYDISGNVAQDQPNSTDLIGKDVIARITPQNLLGFATKFRLRIKGKNPPDMSGIISDRATTINGQLPSCDPLSGYNCNSSGEYVYFFEVESIPDLFVRSVTPGDSSTGIPYNSREISIAFSELLDCTTVNTTNIQVEYIYPGVSPISGTFSCNQDTVTFTADQDFGYSKDIRIIIGTGVRSLLAQYVNTNADPLIGHISTPFNAIFSTEDPPSPYIVEMKPGPISTNVVRDSEIQVTFNEAIDPSSLDTTNFSITDLSSMSILSCSTLELINADTTIRCIPQNLFEYSHNIAVSIRGGTTGIRSSMATERGGWFNPIPDPYTYTFKIIDIPELTVIATNFSQTENFAINANLQIIFNSYVNFTDIIGDQSDLSDDRIILVKQSDINTRIAVTISNPISGSENSPATIRLTPSQPLDYSTAYSVFVFGGYPDGVCRPERNTTNQGGCIVDVAIAGTPYKGLRFDFTTASAPGLAVDSITPPDKSTGIERMPQIKISFNNSIQFATVNGNICLTKGNTISTDCSGPLAVPIKPFTQIDSKTVSTYPVSDLDFDTTYTIVITKGVIDIYGDSLDSLYTSTFTTITSTLVQDILVWDGTQYSNNLFYDLNDAHFRIRFTEDMDTSTVNNGTLYLTYTDEFGQIIPLRGIIAWDAPPNDKKTLYFTPDLYNIAVCDGQELFGWGNDGNVKNTTPDRFSSPSYNFDSSYIGKKIYISNSIYGYNGYYNITGVDSGSLVLENATFNTSESGLNFKIFNPSSSIPYNTQVKIHLTANIWNLSHTKHIAPSSGENELIKSFTSSTNSNLLSISYSNSILRGSNEYVFVSETNLFDAKDVPITSKLKAKFSEKLDPSTVNYKSVVLSDLKGYDGFTTAGSDIFTITTSSFTSTDVDKYIWLMQKDAIEGPFKIIGFTDSNHIQLDNTSSYTANNIFYFKGLNSNLPGVISLEDSNKSIIYDTSKLSSHLEFQKEYSFMLIGKTERRYSDIIKTANGNYIKGITSVRFTTSEETTVVFTPVDYSTTNNEINDPMLFVAIFSRPIDISTVDENSFYVIQNSEKLPTLFTTYPEFPNIVVMIPIPAFKTGINADFTVNKGVRDFRGNPLGRVWNSTLTVSSAPGGSALTLDPPSTETPSNGSTVNPDLEVTLKWDSAGGNFRDLLLPTSFSNYSIKLRNNVDLSYVPIETQLIPGGPSGDTIKIRPKTYLKGGVSYTLTIDLSKCANLYRLPGSEILTYNYTVENTPPQILAAGPTGSGNPATSKIYIAFNEQIDMETVDTSTIVVNEIGGLIPLSGRYYQVKDDVLNRWVVYFEPSVPMRSSLFGYRVTVKSGNTGIKDLGGTPLASDYTFNFNVENTAPKIQTVSPPDGSTGIDLNSDILIKFDEAISPSTIYGADESSNGSINVTYTSACNSTKKTYGCIKISRDMTEVRFIPSYPYKLIGDRNYNIDINETIISDLAGNIMNFLDLSPISSFSTTSGDPILDCEIQPADSNSPIQLYFNEKVDYSQSDSIIVYDITSGTSIAIDLVGISNPNGYTISVYPQSGSWDSGNYGYIITRGIKDIDGNQLIREYNGYFTIP